MRRIIEEEGEDNQIKMLKLLFMHEVSANRQLNVKMIREVFFLTKKALQKTGSPIITNFTDKLFWKYEVTKNMSFLHHSRG